MKNIKKLERKYLKSINGGSSCSEYCPAGPYGPGQPRSCEEYHALSECCKGMVMVSLECVGQ